MFVVSSKSLSLSPVCHSAWWVGMWAGCSIVSPRAMLFCPPALLDAMFFAMWIFNVSQHAMKLHILQWLYCKLWGLQTGQKLTASQTTRHLLQHTMLLQVSEEHLFTDIVSMLQCLHTEIFIDNLWSSKQFLHKGLMPSTRLTQLSQQYGGLKFVCPELLPDVCRLLHSWLLHWAVDGSTQIMHSFLLLPDFGFPAGAGNALPWFDCHRITEGLWGCLTPCCCVHADPPCWVTHGAQRQAFWTTDITCMKIIKSIERTELLL